MKLSFTEVERGDLKTFMEKVVDVKMGARHSDLVVTVFEQKFVETTRKRRKNTCTWVEYHHMVDVIKVFIRTERLADHNGYLSCIVTKMLHIFAAAGHHHNAKGGRAVLSTQEGTRNFACLQRHLTTSHCPREPRCPLLRAWAVRHMVWYLYWADINECNIVTRWTEQRKNEKQFYWPQILGVHT